MINVDARPNCLLVSEAVRSSDVEQPEQSRHENMNNQNHMLIAPTQLHSTRYATG
jgi:hypothetical protein